MPKKNTSTPIPVLADVYLNVAFNPFAKFLPISSLTTSSSNISDLFAAITIPEKHS